MLHGMASAGTVAWVMYQKYVNSLPLYRQEKDFKMYGAEICRGTIANWIINNSEEFFKPQYNAFIKSFTFIFVSVIKFSS